MVAKLHPGSSPQTLERWIPTLPLILSAATPILPVARARRKRRTPACRHVDANKGRHHTRTVPCATRAGCGMADEQRHSSVAICARRAASANMQILPNRGFDRGPAQHRSPPRYREPPEASTSAESTSQVFQDLAAQRHDDRLKVQSRACFANPGRVTSTRKSSVRLIRPTDNPPACRQSDPGPSLHHLAARALPPVRH